MSSSIRRNQPDLESSSDLALSKRYFGARGAPADDGPTRHPTPLSSRRSSVRRAAFRVALATTILLAPLTLFVVALSFPGISAANSGGEWHGSERTRDAAAGDEPDASLVAEDEVRSLLSWAVHLSHYASDGPLPEVRLEPAAFFAINACSGRSGTCRVLGWYADRGVVHIDERLGDMRSLFARSLVVHELVHYLQHRSGRFVEVSCENFVAREREAYAVQQEFFVAYGAMPTIQPHQFACPAPVSVSVSPDILVLAPTPGASRPGNIQRRLTPE